MNEKVYYYVYCQGVIGVKTNIHDFKWIYGSCAPCTSEDEYEKCIIRFNVCIQPEKQLKKKIVCDKIFQAYSWDEHSKTISYRRSLVPSINIGYDIKIDGKIVEATIGEAYFKLVKNRTMNLHGIYYLLSDIANILLLENGFLTLYASAVCHDELRKGIVCFAPPNTGKTVTASKLCALDGYQLIGEDIVITDGKRLFACPWTNSYRKKSKFGDTAGAFGRAKASANMNYCGTYNITDLFVLSLSKRKNEVKKTDLMQQITILNGYLFNYYSSPIVKVLSFFDSAYNKNWNKTAFDMLERIANDSNCYNIQSQQSLDFWKNIHLIISGKDYEDTGYI